MFRSNGSQGQTSSTNNNYATFAEADNGIFRTDPPTDVETGGSLTTKSPMRRPSSFLLSTVSSYGAEEEDDEEEEDERERTEDNVPEKALLVGKSSTTSWRKHQRLEHVHEGVGDQWCWASCCGVILPWSPGYEYWWSFTVAAAVVTAFFETYQIAFAPPRVATPYQDENSICEYILTAIFALDMMVQFRLAYTNERDDTVYNGWSIAQRYLVYGTFWIDLLALLPLEYLTLLFFSDHIQNPEWVALLRLVRLLRLYRVQEALDILTLDTRISLMSLTLLRNFAAALAWTHLAACFIYYLATFPDGGMNRNSATVESFLGPDADSMDDFERYVTALYWSIVTFATVGYGDVVAVSTQEKILAMGYILCSIVIQAWIIGSITLLLIKKDENTGAYRDTLETLAQYSQLHSFDESFTRRLKNQVQLDFSTREIADEHVLKYFPSAIRRKVLRRLYMPYLGSTHLMKGVRQQFVDAFLTTSRVEIFSPGEDIVRRNAISSDLYLLVGGMVESVAGGGMSTNMSLADGTATVQQHQIKAGEFLNEIEFFTESPQIETLRTVSVCKTVTMSRSVYKLLAQDHPGSAGKILQNLLSKVQGLAEEINETTESSRQQVVLPQSLVSLRAGSVFFDRMDSIMEEERRRETLTAVQDLVEMHIEKQKDDHTTRFLFAASRGDIHAINVMCDQGFDPNNSDYDSRTALMVAAMKGNTEVVTRLLEYGANPNLVDMHGSTALYEAARNGHGDTMRILLQHGGSLCLTDAKAASLLDQAVFDGDVVLLRRLLEAHIHVNAVDYDKRAAVHIAAAEGNVAALKVLQEFGADLSLQDRWGNTVRDEAERAKAFHLLQYLDEQGIGTGGNVAPRSFDFSSSLRRMSAFGVDG